MKPVLANLAERIAGCRGVLVDRSILLDIATRDPKWSAWSSQALAECAEHAALVINLIVYAEVSIGFQTFEALNAALPSRIYERAQLPWKAGFLAGKCSSITVSGAENQFLAHYDQVRSPARASLFYNERATRLWEE